MQAIIGKLKAKRFRQIFDYLDTASAGELDLVTLVSPLPASCNLTDMPSNAAAQPQPKLCMCVLGVTARSLETRDGAPPASAICCTVMDHTIT